MAREYRSIEEVRAALYPRTAILLRLPPGALIQLPGMPASEEDSTDDG